MRTTFQIIFCLLAVACVIAAVFLGVFLGLLYCLIAVLGAAVFTILMLLMKNGNPFRKPDPPKNDFMNANENASQNKSDDRENTVRTD